MQLYLCQSHSSVSCQTLWMVHHRYELPGGWQKLLSQLQLGLHLLDKKKKVIKKCKAWYGHIIWYKEIKLKFSMWDNYIINTRLCLLLLGRVLLFATGNNWGCTIQNFGFSHNRSFLFNWCRSLHCFNLWLLVIHWKGTCNVRTSVSASLPCEWWKYCIQSSFRLLGYISKLHATSDLTVSKYFHCWSKHKATYPF